jgi:hypothetical protein
MHVWGDMDGLIVPVRAGAAHAQTSRERLEAAMTGRMTPWAGALLLATALLLLTFFIGRILSPAPPAQLLLVRTLAVGVILLTAARFCLWRLAVGSQGASLLLWSALLGLAGGLMLFSWLAPEFLWMGAVVPGYTIDITLKLVALVLLSIGLLRVRLVSMRVAAIGLASGTLGLVGLLAHGQLGLAPFLAALGLEIVFLFGVAVSLLMRRPLTDVADAPPAPAL